MATVYRCFLALVLLIGLPCRADVRILEDVGHYERIVAIARADAAGIAYSGSRDGRIMARRLSDGRLIARFGLKADRILSALAVNPVNPSLLAMGTLNVNIGDPHVVIFDAAHAQPVRELEGTAQTLQYSADGRYLVGNGFGVINVWLPHDGSLYVSLRCDDGSSVQFLGNHTIAFVANRKLRRLDLDTGRIVGEDSLPFGTRFVVLPGSRSIVLVSQRKVVLWDLQRAAAITEHALLSSPDMIAYDAVSGDVFLGQSSAAPLGDVRYPMYRLFGANLISISGLQGADQVTTVLNAHAGLLMVGQANGRVRRWLFRNTKVEALADLGTTLPEVQRLARSADDRYIAVADLEGAVDILDLESGVQRTFDPHSARLRPPPPRFGGEKTVGVAQTFTVGERKPRPRINDMAFFDGSGVLVVSYGDGDLRIVDATTLAEQSADLEHSTRGVALSPLDKDRMLISAERGVNVWNRASGRRERTIPVSFAASVLRADSEKGLLFAAGRDSAEVWTVGGELVQSLPNVGGCAVFFRGRLIRSDFDNRALSVWNASTRSLEAPLPGPAAPVREHGCVSTRTGAFFVLSDGHIWIVEEAADGRLRSRRFDARTEVRTVARSSKSNVLLLGGPQRSIAAVDITNGRWLGRLTIFDNEEWLAIDPSDRFDGPPQVWSRLRFADTSRPLIPVDPGLGFEALFLPDTLRLVMGLAPATAAVPKVKPKIGNTRPPDVSIQAPQPTYRRRYGLAQESVWRDPGVPGATTIPAIQVGEEYGLVEAGAKLANAPVKFSAEAIDRGGGIGICRLERNRQVIQTFSPPIPAKERVVFEAMVEPLSGENELAFECFDNEGVRGDPARVNVVVESNPVRTGVAYVISIGIDIYAASDKRLRYAVADARFAAETLAKTLASTGRYARTKPVVLVDGDATRESILGVLDRLAGRPGATSVIASDLGPLRPQDAVVVYFSGHGSNLDGRYQLLTHEFDGTPGKGLLSDEELRKRFSDMNARDLLLVIDACESGKALGAAQQRIGPFTSRSFSQMAYEKGMFVLAASQADAAALELESLGHGLLTYVLVKLGIVDSRADRDPKDGTTTVREVFHYAVEQVPIVHREKRVAREIRKDASRGGQVYYVGVERDDDLGYLQVPRAFIPGFGYNSDFVLRRVGTR